MIEILMAALASRMNHKMSPAMPQPSVWDLFRLTILIVGLGLAVALSVTQ